MPHELLEIVLVEDSVHDRELTLRALRRRNVVNPVTVLTDGQQALEHFFGPDVDRASLRRSVCAVLLDLKMPRVDGIEILRRIKSDPLLRSLPVVVLTSSAEEKDRLASYDIGANSYVVKPIDFENFSAAISSLGFYWCVLNTPPEGPGR
jgi:two-component system, response regulator